VNDPIPVNKRKMKMKWGEDSPDEGSDGEHGIVNCMGNDDRFQVRWEVATYFDKQHPRRKKGHNTVSPRRREKGEKARDGTYACY
jgi:hypothetical protein